MIAGRLICHAPTRIAPWGLSKCRGVQVLQPGAEGDRCQLSGHSHDEVSRLCVP